MGHVTYLILIFRLSYLCVPDISYGFMINTVGLSYKMLCLQQHLWPH